MVTLWRVVFDANVWVSAAFRPGSVPDRAIEAARRGEVRSVISESIIKQVLVALAGPKIRGSKSVIERSEREMRALSDLVVPTTVLTVITAKDSDNRILECAVDGRADLIVTGDRKHLLPLGAYAGIPIVTPADFVASLAP
jgi:uncharacterized protein